MIAVSDGIRRHGRAASRLGTGRRAFIYRMLSAWRSCDSRVRSWGWMCLLGLIAVCGLGPVPVAAQETPPPSGPVPTVSGADASSTPASPSPDAPSAAPDISQEMPALSPPSLPEGVVPAGAMDKLPKLPKAPKLPEVPAGLEALLPPEGTAASSGATQTRRELGHAQRLAFYPRVGLLYAIQPRTLPADNPSSLTPLPVMQATLGAEALVALGPTWFVTAEGHALWIMSGSYGFGEDSDGVVRYGEGSITALAGVGAGRVIHLLDSYQVWSRLGLRVGYLHPYYGALWLGGELSREVKRTPRQLWQVTAAPCLGLLTALDARGSEIFQRLGVFGGVQVSAAFIFAPIGG